MRRVNDIVRRGRPGFTLVELLVVLGLMLLLAAVAVTFMPRMTERQRTARGADQLQGWLLIARQWARRDGAATGIRLKPTPGSSYITDLQYIQVPDPYYAGTGSSATVTASSGSTTGTATISTGTATVDFSNGNPNDPSVWIVQGGGVDYLVIPSGTAGKVYSITSVTQSTPGGIYDTLNFTIPAGTNYGQLSGPQPSYQIYRAPRVLPGEAGLQLPQNVIIDTSTNTTYGNNLPANSVTGNYDILFSPNGGLVPVSGPLTDKIFLWVRDVTQNAATPGDQTIIAIYTRTGFIAAHPVDTSVTTTLAGSVAPGTNVQMTVANPQNIVAGNYLVLDPGNATSQETDIVLAVSGNTVTLGQAVYPHNAGAQVISDPYGFAKDGRSSGL